MIPSFTSDETTFWENLAHQFGALDDHTSPLTAIWSAVVGREHAGKWTLRPETDATYDARVRFTNLATKAISALGREPIPIPSIREHDPILELHERRKGNSDLVLGGVQDTWLRAWFEFLREESPEFENSTGAGATGDQEYDFHSGLLPNVCKASANYCLQLATRTLQVSPRRGPAFDSPPQQEIQTRPELRNPVPGEVGRESGSADPIEEGAQRATYGSENRPLPELMGDAKHQFEIARADALVKLHEELNKCWEDCFRVDSEESGRVPDPATFFAPFIAYGVGLYVAFAEALLELSPEPLAYQDWLDFALKTSICEELAPYRPPETPRKPAHDVRLSGWQVHMGITWRHFDHPCHSALSPKAAKLIDALEDVSERHWEPFSSSLHKAISRRTLPLLTNALKRLGGPKEATPEPPKANAECPQPVPALRTELIKIWMDDEGWTNKTLAEKLHTSERVISSLRNNGKYHGRDAVTKLANLMEHDPIDLYLP